MSNTFRSQGEPPEFGRRDTLRLIRNHMSAYMAINAFYYGAVLFGMLIAFAEPSIRDTLIDNAAGAYQRGLLAPVGAAYKSGDFFTAFVLTFIVNLFLGTFLTITLPSAVIPFSGFILAGVRAVMWGIMFMPFNHPLGWGLAPHYVNLLLEGQGYILATFAVYIHGRSFIDPKSMGAATNGQGYALGLAHTMNILALVAITLFIAALFEAFEGVYIVPLLIPAK